MRLPSFCTTVLSAVLLVSSVAAQLQYVPTVGVGTASILSTSCRTVGPLPNTRCLTVRVYVPGSPSRDVEVRISEPDAGVALRGTILFGTGGRGADFYVDQPGGFQLLETMRGRGYRIVDRFWLGGWFKPGPGLRRQSARYATLVNWLHSEIHTTGVFAVTGNSGGAGEISYGLSTWRLDRIVDIAVITGGPPMSRLDLLCSSNSSQTGWPVVCQNLVPAGVMEVAPVCISSPATSPCRNLVTTQAIVQMIDESVLHTDASLNYPNTRVHMIFGARDNTAAVPQGMLYHNEVTSEKVLEFVPGTPHWVAGTQDGRDAIERALLGGASCRAGAATLNIGSWPAVGGTFSVTVRGRPSSPYVVLAGFGAAKFELPWGWLFLGGAVFPVSGGVLSPSTGRAVVTIAVPPVPSLEGLVLYEQAIAGPCFTNLVRVQVLPANP